MQLKQLELAGGGTLTVYLRDCCERMPNVLDRPLVLARRRLYPCECP